MDDLHSTQMIIANLCAAALKSLLFESICHQSRSDSQCACAGVTNDQRTDVLPTGCHALALWLEKPPPVSISHSYWQYKNYIVWFFTDKVFIILWHPSAPKATKKAKRAVSSSRTVPNSHWRWPQTSPQSVLVAGKQQSQCDAYQHLGPWAKAIASGSAIEKKQHPSAGEFITVPSASKCYLSHRHAVYFPRWLGDIWGLRHWVLIFMFWKLFVFSI